MAINFLNNGTFAGRVSAGGASNPTTGAKLHVADGTGAGLEVIPSTTNDTVTLLSYDRSGAGYQSLNFEALDFSFLNGDAIFTNNVGIGETDPSALLHVRAATNVTGTIEVQGGKATVTSIGEVNAELNFGSNDASATGGIGGSIKSITEATNGAYVGMGFYTARQGRGPVVEEAMRISNEGRVGIGTTSPSELLNVRAKTGSGFDGIFIADAFAGTFPITISKSPMLSLGSSTANGATATIFMGASATSTDQDSKIQFNRTGGYLSIFYKGQGTYREHVRYGSPSTSTAMTKMFGYVGVGSGFLSNNPTSAFQFDDPTGASIISTQSVALSVKGGANSNNIFEVKDTSDSLNFVIKSDGDVGIGVTNPGSKLDVGGNIKVSGSISMFNGVTQVLSIGPSGSSAYINTGTSGGTVQFGAPAQNVTNINVQGLVTAKDINTTGSNGYLINGMAWALENSGVLTLGDWDGNEFPTRIMDNNSNEVLRVTDGNVGIGTTTPNKKLEVSAATDTTISIASSDTSINAGQNVGILEFSSNNETSLSQAYTPFSKIKTISESAVSGTSSVNGAITFETALANTVSEKMRIKANGNVGIGTNSPDTKLEVSSSSGGVLRLTSSDTSVASGESIGRVEFKSNDVSTGGNNVMGFVDCLATNAGTTYALTLGTGLAAAATEKMRIDQNGNVGIGIISPGSKLDVDGKGSFGDATTYALKLKSSSGSRGINILSNDGASRGGIDWNTTDFLIRNSSDADILKINYSTKEALLYGSVGIGTTSPDVKLDVVSGTNNGIRVSATDTTSNWRDIGIRSYVTQAEAAALTDHTYLFTTNPTGQTDPAFQRFGGTVIQCRDDGNSNFAIRMGNGTGHATALNLNASGVATFNNTVTATNFILSSDKRLKENIEKVCDNRVKADWKTFELKTEKGEKRYGVIAQELEENHPEFVKTDNEGFKSVKYIDLLIAKIAELEARLEKLEK